MDPDPDIFVVDLQDANKNHFSKMKSSKEVTKSRNQGFSYYFCLLIEGCGSVPQSNGSGSRRPETYGSGSAALPLSLGAS
jgi:hypothetical protein